VPRLLAIRKMLPLSVFGSPSSGKSFLLGAMSHAMRTNSGRIGLRFDDVDIEANKLLLDYENQMFSQRSPDHWVWLQKTGEAGDWYSTVYFGRPDVPRNQQIYPKPFLFRADPLESHPRFSSRDSTGRVICLYDNAGEHYEGGGEQYHAVTGHLRHSAGLIFVFDPTQDQDFRKATFGRAEDMQFKGDAVRQQDILYGNVMNRVLTLRGLRSDERVKIPMVVALTKFDSWRFLLKGQRLPSVYADAADGRGKRFDGRIVMAVHTACREMLLNISPRIVRTIESRCDPSAIIYVPVSATGCAPTRYTSLEEYPFDPIGASLPPLGGTYFRAGDIKPMWAEVPLLTLALLSAKGLVPVPEA
jgi:hypothetical protein